MFATSKSAMNTVNPNGGTHMYTMTPLAGQQIISCGWQNLGNAKNVYASQCFVAEDGTLAYIELVNNGDTPVDTWAYWTSYAPD